MNNKWEDAWNYIHNMLVMAAMASLLLVAGLATLPVYLIRWIARREKWRR